jgi:DNA-binding CsgD family transcriptional regulator
MASRRACLGHGDLAARPSPPEFDRATRSQVLRPSRLEEVQDVFRARCRPQGEEMVIRISEGPTAADRHETRVAFFREDQPSTAPARICLTSTTMSPPLQEGIHTGRVAESASGDAGRPRAEAREELTSQELQIAQLAAEGLSNREIGQQLYLSHRTVASHLYRAFPKLWISSRAQLRDEHCRGESRTAWLRPGLLMCSRSWSPCRAVLEPRATLSLDGSSVWSK